MGQGHIRDIETSGLWTSDDTKNKEFAYDI